MGLVKQLKTLGKSDLLKNSFWGIFSNVIQNIFVAAFFVIIARRYSTEDFGQYLVANGLYQLFAVLSNLGLSQWFIREYVQVEDKTALINRFFKIQFYFGVLFSLISIGSAYALYDNQLIHVLSLLFGFNIIFDNVIYGIRALNIAEFHQKKTFKILIIESVLRLVVACALFVYPFSIITFSIILIIIRLFTLNLFLRIGSSSLLRVSGILKYEVNRKDVWQLVYRNWPFIIIGSVAMLYWRSANIIISKMLTLADVARYEISYKLFAIAQIIPMMLSTTVFPKLAALYGNEGKTSLKPLYNQLFYLYFLFGLLAFTFIFSFGYLLLPLLFGETYSDVPRFTTEMFLTMLVFPTALLQANVLVAMKLERFDMLFNIASLIVNVALSIIGIRYFQSLSVINYSIFISFFIFHVLQDIILIKRGVSSLKHVLKFYVVATAATLIYIYVSPFLSNYIWFVLFWLIAGALVLFATPAGRKGLELVRARGGTKKLAMERNLEGR